MAKALDHEHPVVGQTLDQLVATMDQAAHGQAGMSHSGGKVDLKGYGDLVIGPPETEDEGDDS